MREVLMVAVMAVGSLACLDGGVAVETASAARGAARVGPVPVVDAPAVWDPLRARLVLFGGASYAETWLYDGAAWTLVDGAGPSARSAPSMSWDPERGAVVLFGGRAEAGNREGERLDDTWLWDGARWRELEVPSEGRPGARSRAEMIWDPALRGTLLLGGTVDELRIRVDLLVLTASATGWVRLRPQ
jgi:hypothetical protein